MTAQPAVVAGPVSAPVAEVPPLCRTEEGTHRMSERERHRDGDRAGVPQDAAAKRTRAAQDAHGGSMAPGMVDDTGHPVTEASADRVADTDSAD
ncbi:hypothetical protein [Micromonospora sp. U21]|uniref:hypothetical protein n=1 Tax=Micromonospora sp. U21 TaxID=2824899 RepID=UPI001B3902EC|nr:hypothetical protein [Micromonospora sp. U21]MBQ0904193.1 hypothetical protein [Micromonospora sp. U21]